MHTIWNKLDHGLASIYSEFQRAHQEGRPPAGWAEKVLAGGTILNVSLYYSGDLADIESHGFETQWRLVPGRATGKVDLLELDRLAAHPNVEQLSFPHPHKLMLDKSVPDIGADQVWSATTDHFTGTTGAGVIIGIVDSGIDFRHPYFSLANNAKRTRILRIWDMGLSPVPPNESSPAPSLLSGAGNPTYGVEYTDGMIEKVLQGVPNATQVRHLDQAGHGTHVASVAAGNGRTSSGIKKGGFIGVAPEALLVVVKYMGIDPPTVGGAAVPTDQLFRDAVSYVMNVAAAQAASFPVVINLSFGNALGPHDGLTDNEDWLTKTFQDARGKVVVLAAGNEGGKKQHVRIDFPAGGGTVVVPFRVTVDFLYPYTGSDPRRPAHVQFFYPGTSAAIKFEFDRPSDGLGWVSAPAPGSATVSGTRKDLGYSMFHQVVPQTLTWTGRQQFSRSFFDLELRRGNNDMLLEGTYKVRITATESVTIHGWYNIDFPAKAQFGDGSALPPGVTVEDRFLIGAEGGATNCITVGSYDHSDTARPMADVSARGPLADYRSGLTTPDKPDLAAPGQHIVGALGRTSSLWPAAFETIAKNGTSFSAPHVTGTAALMLQKNPALTSAQILQILRAAARTTPAPVADECGAGRLDAKKAIDQTPP
jgi:subtilisin family serine protease